MDTNHELPSEAEQGNAQIVVRPPKVTDWPAYCAPPADYLEGKWHVVRTTLPMWDGKCNVSITYKRMPPSSSDIPPEQTDKYEDLVEYRKIGATKTSTVLGVDTAASASRDVWNWRGKGWLMIASSHWEVLGFGEEEGGQSDLHAGEQNRWVVTYFEKTLFTPAGLDIYSRSSRGLTAETLRRVEAAIAQVSDEGIKTLASKLKSVVFET